MIVASPIRPGRSRTCTSPMNSASGIDMPIVNVPHALCSSALTTARPRPASAMMTMKRMAMRGGAARDRADLGARDVGERTAATTGRGPQDDHVVDGAGEADAADEPDQSRRVAELRREHGADERSRAGDRGEMVTEQHPAGA